MNNGMLNIKKILARKLSVVFLLMISAVAAFATLGDGKTKSNTTKKSLLSNKNLVNKGVFSLKSGYSFRGNQVISNEKKVINFNTTVSLTKGNTIYTVPLKKSVLFDKVKFNF